MDYWAVISSVVIYILGQAFLKFVLEPIQTFNKERGDLSFLLIYYGGLTAERAKRIEEDDYNPELIAASLVACAAQIPFYNTLNAFPFFKLPSKSDLLDAVTETVKVSERLQKRPKAGKVFSVDKELSKIAALLKIPAHQVSCVQ